ncbi:transposase [Endozoicomonas montiporae]|uniref:ISNCY family transposase n=1 Tax=Endozoicomonas montiporae CL-33 TaxID=570277 RepID=A0A142BDR2_9GAMM|nr:transposase [Endozoicomonas montiporae]AMO55587.1 ISNCY family transposase [Endozoicomonas montiporae CL-33]AMO55689.1 ISNCY family transposase [Endozoicomonas montiporae CL-33]AMO56888.1 ISNCY family transposase [Endozoicomonas montiporae CL-33]AMO57828.1 ISNCY family transposase [Endozoicomonas montiporae CL-33]
MPAKQDKILVDRLINTVRQQASLIPDHRPNNCKEKILLSDAIMSGLAVMHMKCPSLLSFEHECKNPRVVHNLRQMYGVQRIPSDTHLREILDPIETDHFRPFFKSLFSYVQSSKWLKKFQYFEEGYLAPVDGTGHFASGKISCPECCIKKADTDTPQYYHQLLAICLVKPGQKEVLPLMPEPITKQVNASKNDCEKTALKRLLENVYREHPKLKLVLTFDDLYSDGPTIKMVKSYGYSFIMVAKDSDHASLVEAVDTLDARGEVNRYEYVDEDGYRHWFRYVNNVPINKSHKDVLVNYLEYVEISPKGEKYTNVWVTDIQLTDDSVTRVMRGGRAKWKIENETFNTLKTQGYHLEHNYGHGKEHLATNFACLTFTAFLIDQIEQLGCCLFQKAWTASHSKKALWEHMRSLFQWFFIDSWRDFFMAIISRTSEGVGHNIRSVIPDTS